VQNNVAELDVDILVTDAPDIVSLDSENYQSIVQLLGAAPNTPPPILRLLIEMHPGLATKRKKQLLDMIEEMSKPQQADPMAEQAKMMAMERGQAETEKIKAEGFRAFAQAEQAMRPEPAPERNQMARYG
jgi:hypothetical protein